jgi:hypothetical protein
MLLAPHHGHSPTKALATQLLGGPQASQGSTDDYDRFS